jgi:hypothetical protein
MAVIMPSCPASMLSGGFTFSQSTRMIRSTSLHQESLGVTGEFGDDHGFADT